MEADANTKQRELEITSWLEHALTQENLTNLSVDIVGNSEKGDGYSGDIIFIHLSGKAIGDGFVKNYDLVVKCGKQSEAMRASTPVAEAYANEIFMYQTVFPSFQAFEREKGLEKVFDAVPKCYGTYKSGNVEVLFLENLKKVGYCMADKLVPLSMERVKLVLEEYGRWHAISVAMYDQRPEEFLKLANGTMNVWKIFVEKNNFAGFCHNGMDDAADVVEMDDATKKKWQSLQKSVPDLFKNLGTDFGELNVIQHGDCWTNNFMFKDADKTAPAKVAILDWQICRFGNPVYDLSYFLYACLPGEELRNLEDILKIYHRSLSCHVKKLGSDPDKLYPFQDLLKYWKKHAKFGLVMGTAVIRTLSSELENIPDIAEAAENGMDMMDTFNVKLKNVIGFRSRASYIIDHFANSGLL